MPKHLYNHTYYTYKITADGSNRYYLGVSHVRFPNATSADCLAHSYMGSGGRIFTLWKKKYQGSLHKEILGIYPTKEEGSQAEKELIGDLWKTDEYCLNMLPGGFDHKIAVMKDFVTEGNCPRHGITSFMGIACAKCTVEKQVSTKLCPVHGETKFRGSSCSKCALENRVMIRTCPDHGSVDHRGDRCLSCPPTSVFAIAICEYHGERRHRDGLCLVCRENQLIEEKSAASAQQLRREPRKDSPKSQLQRNALAVRNCPQHGLVTHQGKTCSSCTTEKQITFKECPLHGMTKFRGNACYKCIQKDVYSIQNCPLHGEVTFRGNSCQPCIVAKTVEIRECSVHGLVPHRSSNCQKCSAMKTAHRRFHSTKPNADCPQCVGQ